MTSSSAVASAPEPDSTPDVEDVEAFLEKIALKATFNTAPSSDLATVAAISAYGPQSEVYRSQVIDNMREALAALGYQGDLSKEITRFVVLATMYAVGERADSHGTELERARQELQDQKREAGQSRRNLGEVQRELLLLRAQLAALKDKLLYQGDSPDFAKAECPVIQAARGTGHPYSIPICLPHFARYCETHTSAEGVLYVCFKPVTLLAVEAPTDIRATLIDAAREYAFYNRLPGVYAWDRALGDPTPIWVSAFVGSASVGAVGSYANPLVPPVRTSQEPISYRDYAEHVRDYAKATGAGVWFVDRDTDAWRIKLDELAQSSRITYRSVLDGDGGSKPYAPTSGMAWNDFLALVPEEMRRQHQPVARSVSVQPGQVDLINLFSGDGSNATPWQLPEGMDKVPLDRAIECARVALIYRLTKEPDSSAVGHLQVAKDQVLEIFPWSGQCTGTGTTSEDPIVLLPDFRAELLPSLKRLVAERKQPIFLATYDTYENYTTKEVILPAGYSTAELYSGSLATAPFFWVTFADRDTAAQLLSAPAGLGTEESPYQSRQGEAWGDFEARMKVLAREGGQRVMGRYGDDRDSIRYEPFSGDGSFDEPYQLSETYPERIGSYCHKSADVFRNMVNREARFVWWKEPTASSEALPKLYGPFVYSTARSIFSLVDTGAVNLPAPELEAMAALTALRYKAESLSKNATCAFTFPTSEMARIVTPVTGTGTEEDPYMPHPALQGTDYPVEPILRELIGLLNGKNNRSKLYYKLSTNESLKNLRDN